MHSRRSPLVILAVAATLSVAFIEPALAGTATTQTAGVAADPALARDLQALLDATYAADGPGAGAIVTRGGQVIFAGGRGLADIPGARSITADTPFRLGSIVKQFTAAVVLQLVDEGRVSLDEPLSRYLTDFPEPTSRATIRQLLNHTSGVQDFTKIPGWMGGEASLRPNATADLVALMRDRPAVSEPGTRWEYNNGGYVLLGAVIEQVTGQPWQDAVMARIGRPLGLTSLAYIGAPSERTALGYAIQNGAAVPATPVHFSVAHAAGGLVASAADLARWADALHHGRAVTPAMYREMTAPARLADGSTRPYGFGLRLVELRGRPALFHGGAGRGVDTGSVWLPEADVFVAVLTNSDDLEVDAGALTRRMAAAALGEPIPAFTPLAVEPAQVTPLLGVYRPERGEPANFFIQGDRLYLGHGDDQMEVFPAGEDRFFFGPDDLTWFRILRQADGAHVMEINTVDAREPERAVRSGVAAAPLTVDAAILASYVGTYATEAPVLIVAMGPDGVLTMGPAGQQPARLRPVSDVEFRLDDGGTRVVFHPEGGVVDRVTLYRGARQLNGRRVAAP